MSLRDNGSGALHDAAVSFAGEDRSYVARIMDQIRGEFDVYYDEDYVAESWGQDGVEYFTDVYMNQTRYVLMFVSRQYAESVWTNVEKRAALAKAITQKAAYILPIQMDDTQLDGIPPTVIYVDARVHGVDGLVALIRAKLRESDGGGSHHAGTVPADRPRMKVPRTPEEMQLVMEARPYGWEYLLWAGALRLGMDALEGKYRDHVAGYTRRSDEYVSGPLEFLTYAQKALQDGLRIGQNFVGVLSQESQTAAFGPEGEPGDPDRILHMAQRLVGVYEDFLDWSASLRGVAVTGEHARASLRALSNTATGNIEMLRKFVDDAVEWADAIADPRDEDEIHEFQMTLTLDLDDGYLEAFAAERDAAIDETDPTHLG